jgi:hypothetical protein
MELVYVQTMAQFESCSDADGERAMAGIRAMAQATEDTLNLHGTSERLERSSLKLVVESWKPPWSGHGRKALPNPTTVSEEAARTLSGYHLLERSALADALGGRDLLEMVAAYVGPSPATTLFRIQHLSPSLALAVLKEAEEFGYHRASTRTT